MKKIGITLIFSIFLTMAATACTTTVRPYARGKIVIVQEKENNGKQKGHYKKHHNRNDD